MTHYSFKPGWGWSLVFLVVFALFIRLGMWQVHRADEKKALQEAQEQRVRDEPVALRGDESSPDDLRYRRVLVAGEYDAAHQFLLDNQVHAQSPGYHVLTPLRITGSDRAVLVNRGWIPWGAERTHLPDLALRETVVRISGMADRFPGVGLRLRGAEIPAPGWPSLVQVAEPERLAERLGYKILPYQVLLDDTAGEGYVRAWHETRLTPEKNLGYALQWFLFAAVAAAFYLWHGLKAGAPAETP